MRLLVIVMLLLSALGCASEKDREPQVAVSTPLEFDPTEEYDLAAWWTNGQQLLHLKPDGAYILYDGMNRYRARRERGRWWQHSYAALFLEPYARIRQEPARVAIRKVEGELRLNVRKLEPMSALPGPPPVLEDRLVGGWSGAFGVLWLGDNQRYELSPRAAGDPTHEAALAGHQGLWQVYDEDTMLLTPDSPGVSPVLVRIETREGELILETADGPLVRYVPPVERG